MGTASEQKAKSAKSGLNTTFKPLFHKCDFEFYFGKSKPLLYDTSKEIPCLNEFL